MDLEDRYIAATPEGVSLSVVLAGLGSRFTAYLLDVLIQMVALIVFVLALGALLHNSGETGQLVAIGALYLFIAFDFIGYFVLFDMLWSGRSPGKRMTGLQVVRVDGGPVGFWSSVLRNVLRLVDIMPTGYLVGSILVLATPRNQRLGDLAGGTVVVRHRTAAVATMANRAWTDAGQWTAPVGGGHGWVPFSPAGPGVVPAELAHWDVSAVGPDDVMLAGMFLSNRFGYAPEARARLGIDLANRIWPRVAGAPTNLAPEQFLEAVVLVKSIRG